MHFAHNGFTKTREREKKLHDTSKEFNFRSSVGMYLCINAFQWIYIHYKELKFDLLFTIDESISKFALFIFTINSKINCSVANFVSRNCDLRASVCLFNYLLLMLVLN